MKKINLPNTLYEIDSTSQFDKQLKKIYKQGKNLEKLITIVEKLANKEPIEKKYNDHPLINNNIYKNCRELHIEPDWLLIYMYKDKSLILLLFSTGSHSDLFNN